MLDKSDGETKRIVGGTKLLGIAPCEIIVDGYDMHGTSHERCRDRGQQRRQRLAFAGLHFGEGAAHHCGAAEQLNAEMAHARMPARGLSCERKSQGYLVRIEARRQQSPAQLVRGLAQSFIRQAGQPLFLILGTLNKPFELPFARSPESKYGETRPHAFSSAPSSRFSRRSACSA